jgi:hypothetical protein
VSDKCILKDTFTINSILLKRGAKLLMKGPLDGVSEDAAKEKLATLAEFPVALKIELPEKEAEEEKVDAGVGVVKLANLPAVDGFASHGMFARVGRIAEVSDFACTARAKSPSPAPTGLTGMWLEVAELINTLSTNLDQLTGHVVPTEDASAVLEVAASKKLPPGTLPFDIGSHQYCRSNDHAKATLQRWADDLEWFAAKVAKTEQHVLKLPAGQAWPDSSSLVQLADRLQEAKLVDERLVRKGMEMLDRAAGHVDEAEEQDKIRFALLRYSGQEPGVWLEHTFATLLTSNPVADWHVVNPFLSDSQVQLVMDLAMLIMLRSNRLGLLNCALQAVTRVLSFTQSLDDKSKSFDKCRLALGQASEALTGWLLTKRAYTQGDTFDPRFLAFEFTRNIILRPNQVDLVNTFVRRMAGGDSGEKPAMVKQMIMGQGKTAVVSPLLVLILADSKQLVTLVVPGALLEQSRSVLRETFSSVLTKKVGTFECDRSMAFDPHMLAKLEKARDKGAVVVTVPTAVKSLMLHLVENMQKLQEKSKDEGLAVTELRSQVRQIAKALTLFRTGVVLMMKLMCFCIH